MPIKRYLFELKQMQHYPKALAEAFTYDDMVEIKVSETKAKKALIIEGEENQ